MSLTPAKMKVSKTNFKSYPVKVGKNLIFPKILIYFGIMPVLCLVTQSCPTLCDPMDCSPLGSSVYGILQARILEWVAIPFSTDLPDPGNKLWSPGLQADSSPGDSSPTPIKQCPNQQKLQNEK